MNDNEIILFGHKKNGKILIIVDICIMLIMLVIDILVCPGDIMYKSCAKFYPQPYECCY